MSSVGSVESVVESEKGIMFAAAVLTMSTGLKS
jgi:hypothetical protein